MLPRKLTFLFCFILVGIIGFSFTEIKGAYTSILAVITDNVTVCGTSTTLTTSTIPGYSNPIWNDGTTGTSLTVNASGDYWWQVTGANVVTNGDFTSGNTGFTSSYTYKAKNGNQSALFLEATYGVYTDPNALHSGFSSYSDHTGNSPANQRNMLIVNGAQTANTIVWTQNITVSANTDYVFSVWVSSANAQNPAQLQFSINGSPLGTIITPPTTTGVWQYFTTTWTSGAAGTFPIALVNQNTAASGNDFAVDDIVFAPVYRRNVHVVLNPIPVLTLTGPHTACGSYNLTQTIVGYDTNTYDYFFKDSNGNTITTANATAISLSGTYTITEQNKTTGCTSQPVQTTVTINPNPQKPGISPL
ncbi:hypothetical protein [Mucilaginibacter sp. UR6-11]|uniref:hypothetical protein n=1 Tax=Mucilaginibacter sp. UR6-11 TaxID=1435644 RepID=UPI001E651234|nr:hypothetical protein [Mucilaginibacter sp. UR6-11]MCC8424525.1 hypothetical protein [Mucilaginibacter sp. UR6-11]